MSFNPEEILPPGANIKVIGIGGGGGNAINTMINTGIEGVEFIAANTDVQALNFSLAPKKIQIGKELTKGLGAGADPDIGRDAALEDRHAILEALEGANMVFVTAGMGGGTGTGGAAVAAQIARDMGALTVGVVTKPFGFEGKRRKGYADVGICRLQESVDTIITIPNQRLLQVASPDLSMVDAFKMADNVLVNAVKGISDIINIRGTVNVDFADVKTVMSCMGRALMGIGLAEGQDRARDAARQAVSSPLLEDVHIEGATGILINITSGSSISLMEVNEACSAVQEAAHEDCNIIFGAVIDENMGDLIRVTVIATGFPTEEGEEQTSRPRNSKVTETQPHQIPSRPVFNDTKRIEVKKTIEEPDILLTRMGETSNSDRLSSEIIENEVEAQINGAIEISERVDKEVSDDLDVPAFLRSSVKDLSLS
ncbi:MAG: cell division protein FtsZ [Zetaproteobacteria bacterium]|nr:cell division protein FtsZ [Pseudobdellovibrionaceae bacterium]